MRRKEEQHNTPQQVRDYLTEALAIVGELEVTDELRVPAFEKACDLLAGKQVTFEQVAPAGFDLSRLPRG